MELAQIYTSLAHFGEEENLLTEACLVLKGQTGEEAARDYARALHYQGLSSLSISRDP